MLRVIQWDKTDLRTFNLSSTSRDVIESNNFTSKTGLEDIDFSYIFDLRNRSVSLNYLTKTD
jgi:hypothetical protein